MATAKDEKASVITVHATDKLKPARIDRIFDTAQRSDALHQSTIQLVHVGNPY
eukprot:CAMPEP_0183363410 /NCGR_PEP_ID=MMETSP0164_2-20130417/75018_1 /TAXON_ID=221442 /ORGANISM="Coccolithus pelagicus ssp braarudi, Strain PLY182g" /LENGTH=52 /DNA_ID=CAMNT_0025538499 /DNA_START=16 /DNA_END=171 /DNA_ORIENTATION=+